MELGTQVLGTKLRDTEAGYVQQAQNRVWIPCEGPVPVSHNDSVHILWKPRLGYYSNNRERCGAADIRIQCEYPVESHRVETRKGIRSRSE